MLLRVRTVNVGIMLMLAAFIVPPLVGGQLGALQTAGLVGQTQVNTQVAARELGGLNQLAMALDEAGTALEHLDSNARTADHWQQIDAAFATARRTAPSADSTALDRAALSYREARRLSAQGRDREARRGLAAAQHETLEVATRRTRSLPQVLEPVSDLGKRQRIGVLVGFTGTMLAGLGMTLWLRRAVQRPLRDLETAAARISTADFQPVRANGLKEFVPIAEAFNAMAEQLRVDRDELTYRANHDALTGLPTRVPLFEAIDRIVAAGQDLSVLFLDLDGFKTINDSLGHAVGDRVLVEVSKRLRHALRPTDLVARLGGDEFAVVLCGAPTGCDPSSIAHRLRLTVASPMIIDGNAISVDASIGIADAGGLASASDIVSSADHAMYAVKAAQRRDRPGLHARQPAT